MVSVNEVRQIVGEILQLGDRTASLGEGSALMGAMPEFDSMAVVSILTRIEEDYGIFIDDDEMSAEIFETLGSLTSFVAEKVTNA